jgi:tRNA pseudouridine55 synthase
MSLNGVLVVDKPPGKTSHDIVQEIRRILKMKRVGHAGTLDPDATGVLVVLVGEGTKISSILLSEKKKYQGEMVLGIETDTFDSSGQVTADREVKNVSRGDLERVFQEFVGTIRQVPPRISAVKVRGTPLYKLARQGKPVKPLSRKVQILRLNLLDFKKNKNPVVSFEVECSKGTYIRSLVSDIGTRLGCGAHLKKLIRTSSGNFTLDEAHTIDEIRKAAQGDRLKEVLIPLARALDSLPYIKVKSKAKQKVANGAPVMSSMVEFQSKPIAEGELIKILSTHDQLLGIHKGTGRPGVTIPVRMFQMES